MRIIKQGNGLQIKELGKRQAKEEGCKYGVFSIEGGDFEVFVDRIEEGLEWLCPEYAIGKDIFKFFGEKEALRMGFTRKEEV